MSMQLNKSEILQCERDVQFVCLYTESHEEAVGMKIEDMAMIRNAARLSMSYICNNPDKASFQLYERLQRMAKASQMIKST